MPASDLQDLILPRTDTTTARHVLNGYMRGLTRAFATYPAQSLGPAARAIYSRTLALVLPKLKTDPRKIVATLRQPTLAALLWSSLSRGGREADAWMIELCLLLHFELALSGEPLDTTPIPRPGQSWPTLRSVAARLTLQIDPSVEQITFDAALLKSPPAIGRPYHPIVDGIGLALSDNNPLAMEEAHPDKSGNAIDLGGHPLEEWTNTLRSAFQLVDEFLPVIGQEMRLVLRLIVPVGYHEQRHLSASYQEAVGTIYMTLHPNLMTMTEALVHEFQHNKINAAFHLDPMLHNAFSPLYTSPVRPDPRPLHGVILAVHAFQPIAKMYELMTASEHPISKSPSFQKRFRDIIRMNRAGSQTVLGNAQPTAMGQPLFDEMRALEQEQLAYEEAHWPSPAAEPAPVLPE